MKHRAVITVLDRVRWSDGYANQQHNGTVIEVDGDDYIVSFDKPVADHPDIHSHYKVGICYLDELELLEE